MRPVNLLPQKHRPHQSDGSKSGSAYVVVGVLVVLLGMAVAYVLEANKISDAKSKTAAAEQATAEARARATANGPYANFAQVKQARVDQVKQLANDRFDWERTLRELSLVLPDGVWIQDVSASTSGTDSSAGATPTTSSSNPSLQVHGCAYRQPSVAETIVRLRQMEAVSDVTLSTSTRPDGAGHTKKASGDGSNVAGDSAGCGTHDGIANYDFTATVEFSQPTTTTTGQGSKIPVRLGGGS